MKVVFDGSDERGCSMVEVAFNGLCGAVVDEAAGANRGG
jgi:hypothetical protein